MSESLLPDNMMDAMNATVMFPSANLGTVETRPTQLWEVIVVISCPVLFVLFLCCCIVCMIIKNYDRQPSVEPLRRRNLGRIMRQLPPPPKYDVAIASSQSPPPLYSDIEKGVIFDPLRSLSSTAPSSPTSPEAPPMAIQYLYPPRYESPAVHSPICRDDESIRSPTPTHTVTTDARGRSAITHRPSVTVIVMNGAL
ncbi:hypothetical protein Y032_0279g1208 [Ancylostoma ceylanicum]|uniref:Uncharacterized protein n=1 Tax=Ancylostoma ceylanicum TaxID=53326 RepID=A0A016S6Y9_9BILA|nr:hypothetical protein Y032_0279g1208 [Ancylostoma ceylanicum]